MKLKIQIAVFMALIIALSSLFYLYKSERKNRIRIQNNQSILLSEASEYKTKDGLNAISIGQLNFKIKELKKYRGEDLETIKDLGIKLKRVKSIKTIVKDSIRIVHVKGDPIPIIDTLRCIESISPFLELNGCIDANDYFTGKITTTDSLTQILHAIPKKFLFIKYGVKSVRQEAFWQNPDSHIKYAEIIEIRRRNK